MDLSASLSGRLPDRPDAGHSLEVFLSQLVKYDESSLVSAIASAVLATLFLVMCLVWLHLLPGHKDNQWFPLVVAEHYGPRNSQHLLDPYSAVHFSQGILSYYILGFLDDDQHPDKGHTEGPSGKGLLTTLLVALGFEVLENTDLLIDRFRQNSGTSEEYRGDSSLNVVGDVLSTAVGYNLARFLITQGFSRALPLLIYFLMEYFMAITIRDNLFLIIWQLMMPQDWIKQWQAQAIP